MTEKQIKHLVLNTKTDNNNFPLSNIIDLKKIANFELSIDRNTGDYYYEVNINDLVDKDFDDSLITDYNWELSKDEKKIILFI